MQNAIYDYYLMINDTPSLGVMNIHQRDVMLMKDNLELKSNLELILECILSVLTPVLLSTLFHTCT